MVIVVHLVACTHTRLTHLPIFSRHGMRETRFHLWLFTMLSMVGRCSGVCADDSWPKTVQHKMRMQHVLTSTSFMLIALRIVDVTWPANLGCEGGANDNICTVQWQWTTAWGEQFWNCIDVKINGGGGGGGSPSPTPTPRPRPTPTPRPRPRPSGGGAVGALEGYWTSNGATLTFKEQNRKTHRVCWDVGTDKPTTVYYQSKGETYHSWNADVCCLATAPEYAGKAGGPASIIQFDIQYGFGFCECLGWNPSSGTTVCAGKATADNMKCPVSTGSTAGTCPDPSPLSIRPSSLGGPVGSDGG